MRIRESGPDPDLKSLWKQSRSISATPRRDDNRRARLSFWSLLCCCTFRLKMSAALVARVVATTNRPPADSFTLRSTVTLYRIHVRQFADSTRSWCVLRRYSEFVELHEVLLRSIGLLPTLPPKLVVNTAESLADRYLALDAYVRSLLAMPSVAEHARLRSFLGATWCEPSRCLTSLSRPGSEHERASPGEAGTMRDVGGSGSAPGRLGSEGANGSGIVSAVGSPMAASPSPPEVEDDWEIEADALEDDATDEATDGASPPRSPARSEGDGGGWLLTGHWVADEERSRDTLEPMMKAMGTPWAARRMLRGVVITSMLKHEAGVRLSELASSSLGVGKPAVFDLDGVARPLWIGRREGRVRAIELRGTGAVRLEFTLPDGKGTIRDTRRVLGGGDELERIVEIRLASQPPLRIHRLLVRQPSREPPEPRPSLTMADTANVVNAALRSATSQAPADAASAPVRLMADDTPPSALARAIGTPPTRPRLSLADARQERARRRARPPPRGSRLYRHERGLVAIRWLLDGLGAVLALLVRPLVRLCRLAPVGTILVALVLALHGWHAHLSRADPAAEFIVAVAAVGAVDPWEQARHSEEANGDNSAAPAIAPVMQLPLQRLLLVLDALAVLMLTCGALGRSGRGVREPQPEAVVHA